MQEENLKSATGSNRPLLYLGGENSRKENARTAVQSIADIDPEYAVGLVQNELGWGLGEASSIVRPGSPVYKKFVDQIKPPPRESSYIKGTLNIPDTKRYESDLSKWEKDVKSKMNQFLKKGYDTNSDSMQAFRLDMVNKGIPDELVVQEIKKAFPGGSKDDKLGSFNKNEFPRLSDPLVPGIQDIFNNISNGNFLNILKKSVESGFTGKK